MIIKWKPLLLSIAISLGVGLLARVVNPNISDFFEMFNKPPLTPPAWLFGVVWTILYTLMGVSAYLIYESDIEILEKKYLLKIYAIQLLLNFIWTIIFFTLHNFLYAFFVLVLLGLSIAAMIFEFKKADVLASKLQIPYLLWVTFAGYLNLAVYFINR